MSSNVNSVCIAGRLTKDAELKATKSGASILNCGIAVNESRKNAQGEWSDYANFFDFVMFGPRVNALSKYLQKGKKVTLSGRLHQDTWEDAQGNNRSKVVIMVNDIELPPKEAQGAGAAAPNRLINVQNTAPAVAPAPSAGVYDQEIPF